MQAANDNTPVRLTDIISIAFPLGGITAAGLRREARRGRLTLMRIAGKDFTTLSAIEEMKAKCLVPENQHASGSDLLAKTETRSGSFSTAASSTARDAALLMCKALRKRSPST